jgi:hypothetical protein
MGQVDTHELPNWSWLAEHEVVATQTPLLTWNPDLHATQKDELRHEAQLDEQLKHFWLRESP